MRLLAGFIAGAVVGAGNCGTEAVGEGTSTGSETVASSAHIPTESFVAAGLEWQKDFVFSDRTVGAMLCALRGDGWRLPTVVELQGLFGVAAEFRQDKSIQGLSSRHVASDTTPPPAPPDSNARYFDQSIGLGMFVEFGGQYGDGRVIDQRTAGASSYGAGIVLDAIVRCVRSP